MGESGRFKFKKAHQRSREITIVPFDDVIGYARLARDAPRAECFPVFCINALKCRHVPKFKNELKKIINSIPAPMHGRHDESEDSSVTKWRDSALESLLECVAEADAHEMKFLMLLLAALFRDFGACEDFPLPLDQLLTTLEKSFYDFADSIYSLLATYFRLHTNFILGNVPSFLSCFMPWLSHRHHTLRDKSLDVLSLLLRRCPSEMLGPLLWQLLTFKNGEVALFGLVRNAQATFTSKLSSIFVQCCQLIYNGSKEKVSTCTDAKDEKRAAANCMRAWVVAMYKHSRQLAEFTWILKLVDEIWERAMTSTSDNEFTSAIIALEPALEMYIVFVTGRQLIKLDFAVLAVEACKHPKAWDALVSDLVMPLCSLATAGKVPGIGDGFILHQCTALVLQLVKCGTLNDYGLLDKVFHQLLRVSSLGALTSPLLSMCEWRIMNSNSQGVANACLHLSLVLKGRVLGAEAYDSVFVNTKLVDAVVDALVVVASSKETATTRLAIQFACTSALAAINGARRALKIPPCVIASSVADVMFESCLDILNGTHDSKLVKLAARTFVVVLRLCNKASNEWLDKIINVLERNFELVNDAESLELLRDNYNDRIAAMVPRIFKLLPCANVDVTIEVLEIAKLWMKGSGLTSALDELIKLQELPLDFANGRKKSLCMSRAVDIAVAAVKTASVNSQVQGGGIMLIVGILASQFYVNYTPLWTSAQESLLALSRGLANSYSILNEIYKAMWHLCDVGVNSELKQDNCVVKNHCIEDDLLGLYTHRLFEQNDNVDVENVYLQALQVIRHLLQSNKGLQREHVPTLATHVASLFDTRDNKRLYAALEVIVELLKHLHKDNSVLDVLVEKCAQTGLVHHGSMVSSSSLKVLAFKFDDSDLDTLEPLANGKLVAYVGDGLPRAKSDLYKAVEIRLFVSRILQRQSGPVHNKAAFEYMATMEPCWITLALTEMFPMNLFYEHLPEAVKNSIFKCTADLPIDLKIGHDHYFKPSLATALHTCSVMIDRLQQALEPQVELLTYICCILLAKLNVQTEMPIHKRLVALLVQMPQMISTGTQRMLDVIMKHVHPILTKFAAHEMIVPLVKHWVEHDEFCQGCQGLMDKVFVHDSSLEIAKVLLDQIGGGKGQGDASSVKKNILVESAQVILDTLQRVHASAKGAASQKVLELVQGLCRLGIEADLNTRAFGMLLEYAPSRMQLKKRGKSTRVHMEKIKRLRLFLDVLLQFFASNTVNLESQQLEKLESVAILVLDFVVDATSRLMAASLLSLSKCAGTTPTDAKLMELLVKANTIEAKGIDARVSVDVNMDVYMELLQVLETCAAATTNGDGMVSSKCLYIWTEHVLFLAFSNQKDVGLVTCSTSVLEAILDVMCRMLNSGGNHQATDGYCTHILNDAILGMARRILLSKSLHEPMTKFAFQLLKLYSGCLSTIAADIRPPGLYFELQNEIFDSICTKACAPQRHLRLEALLQLVKGIKSGNFGRVSINHVVIPIALHMTKLGTSDKDAAICRAAIQCLTSAATILDARALYKLFERLVSLQGVYAPAAIVAILQNKNIALAYERDTATALKLDALLNKLKGRLMVTKGEVKEEMPSPPVFEAVGALLKHYPEEMAIKHAVQLARISSKTLCSRDRKVRRMVRVALVKLVQQLGMSVLYPLLEMLSKSLTRGFQIPVCTFTSCAMFSAILTANPQSQVDVNVANLLLDMIEQEFIYMQQRADTPLQTDEARHPRARQLCILMAKHGNAKVVTTLCSRLAHALWGVEGTVAQLQRNDKFCRHLENLLEAVATGFSCNEALINSGDAMPLVCQVALGNIWYVGDARDILTRMIRAGDENTINVQALEKEHVDAFYADFDGSCRGRGGGGGSAVELLHVPAHTSSRLRENLNRRMQLLPGASTGRALDFDPQGKTKGLCRPFVASMMVSCCLSLYYKLMNRYKQCIADIKLTTLDFNIIATCFLVEDVAVQRASVGCLVQLAGTATFLASASDLVADALVARIYTLQNHAPELARGYLRLANALMATRHSKLLLERIDVVGCLKQRILQNITCPQLQIQLLKLADALECRDEALYSLVLDVMLKGSMVPGAFTLAPKFLSRYILAQEETHTQRWNRLAILIKHLNSEIPRVRLAVLSTLSRVMVHVASQGNTNGKAWWSQFMTLLATALARLVASDDDDGCKGKMVAIVAQMWRDATSETRLEMIASIVYFNKQQHQGAILPYYILCCAKSGVGMEPKVLDALVPCVDFSTGCKLTRYYWIRILECLLQMSSIKEALVAGKVHAFIAKVWEYAKKPKDVLHPWIFAASARCVALVLASARMVERLLGHFSDFAYALLQPCFQMMTLDTMQRHARVAQACRDVCNGTLTLGLCDTAHFKTTSRIISKICWLVRGALKRRHENAKRLLVLVDILTHACKQPATTEKTLYRATLLRIMIALVKVANARTRVSGHGKRRLRDGRWSRAASTSEVNPNLEAQSTLQWLERKFAKMSKSLEHLELLSFARNYVSASRLASRRRTLHGAVLDPARAAKRKIKRHKRRRDLNGIKS